MKILIATGIYPPDIGGPAQFARGVEEAWRKAGHEVKVLAFRLERKLSTGIRHLYYFFRVVFSLRGVDFVFSPDTWSAAFPATIAAKLFGKKIIIRTGGDFLWEQYVERTGDLVLLRDFYSRINATPIIRIHPNIPNKKKRRRELNLKEKVVLRLVRFLFRRADAIIFSTAWQRDIFEKPYDLNLTNCSVVENYYGALIETQIQHTDKLEFVGMSSRAGKVFVGGVRELKWKNMPRLKEAFERVQKKGLPVQLQWETGSRGKFLQDIRDNYAVIIASLGDISPNTILEAISFGKPFILTRETGLYDKLKDIGVWVNPEDVDDIAAKIEWLAHEKNYAEQCKKVAAFAFTHSYEEIAEEILGIYHGLK